MNVFMIDIKKYRKQVDQLVDAGRWDEAKKLIKEYTRTRESN